jgi:hypothetical protein
VSLLAAPGRSTELERAFDPECLTMARYGEELHAAADVYYRAWYLLTDALLPDVGAQFDASGLSPVLAWPWVVPVGSEVGRRHRRHRCYTEVIRGIAPHRLVPELGVHFADDTSYWVRSGYGLVFHPQPSRVGLSLGLGPTLHFGGDTTLGSISPEVGIRYGACCEPLYSTLVARYEEHVLGGEGRLVMIKLGLVSF